MKTFVLYVFSLLFINSDLCQAQSLSVLGYTTAFSLPDTACDMVFPQIIRQQIYNNMGANYVGGIDFTYTISNASSVAIAGPVTEHYANPIGSGSFNYTFATQWTTPTPQYGTFHLEFYFHTPGSTCIDTIYSYYFVNYAPTVGGTTAVAGSDINLSGNVGAVLKWQKSSTGCTGPWTDIPASAGTTTQSSVGITSNTFYRAVIQNGKCAVEYSSCSPVFIPYNINIMSYISPFSSPDTMCNRTTAVPIKAIVYNNSTTYSGGLNFTYSISNASSVTIAGPITENYAASIGPGTFNYTFASTWMPSFGVFTLHLSVSGPAGNTGSPLTTSYVFANYAPSAGGTASVSGSNVNLTGITGDVLKWSKSNVGCAGPWTDISASAGTTSQSIAGVTTDTYYYATVKNGTCPADGSSCASKVFTTGAELYLQHGDSYITNVIPNPFSDQLHVELFIENSGKLQIALFDMMGNCVLTDELFLISSGNQTIQIDCAKSHLSDGIYLLQLRTETVVWNRKVTVVR